MSNDKKSIIVPVVCCLSCYIIWGAQPVYWALLSDFDPMFVMCCRIVFSVVLTWLYMIAAGRFAEIKKTLKDRRSMKLLIPAAVFLCADWGLYIWAVNAGHVIDSNLGYYFNPLVIFLVGVFFFKEKSHALEFAAIGIACLGIIISSVSSASLPYISLCFAVVWPIYATIKKYARADAMVSFSIEVALMLPLALAVTLIFYRGEGGLADATWSSVPLFFGAGLVTAAPMILYNSMVNSVPFKVTGVMQYVGTTIGMICGLMMGEELTKEKIVIFAGIVLALIIFTIGNKKGRKQAL